MIKQKEVMKDNLILETIFSCDKKDLLFFDIETTGFSPENSVLYLIGFICFEEGEPVLHQWFSEKKEDEKTLILEFYQLAHTKKILISYNGTTFDLRKFDTSFPPQNPTSPYSSRLRLIFLSNFIDFLLAISKYLWYNRDRGIML